MTNLCSSLDFRLLTLGNCYLTEGMQQSPDTLDFSKDELHADNDAPFANPRGRILHILARFHCFSHAGRIRFLKHSGQLLNLVRCFHLSGSGIRL